MPSRQSTLRTLATPLGDVVVSVGPDRYDSEFQRAHVLKAPEVLGAVPDAVALDTDIALLMLRTALSRRVRGLPLESDPPRRPPRTAQP